MSTLSFRCPKANGNIVLAEDQRPCHESIRVHRPEPVAPPGLKPYLERDAGSAFGPPLECEWAWEVGSWDATQSVHPKDCQCDGNGYVNAVRLDDAPPHP